MQISFSKMHGIGNDMIVIDNRDGSIQLDANQIQKLCDRHFGIGADGLILIEKSTDADCFMNYHNSDGSIGEMCGNGIRCAALFFQKLTNEARSKLKIATRAGIKTIHCQDSLFTVNMGPAHFESPDFPSGSLELEGFRLHCVSMGNPHAVTFVENLDSIDLENVGPKIETAPQFPHKINFEIVEILNPDHLKMRVWERGSGITLACGTGACAVFATAQQHKKVEGKVCISLPGGDLWIEENSDGEILMTGPAELIFDGTINL